MGRTKEFNFCNQYMPSIRFLSLNNGETEDRKQEEDKATTRKSLDSSFKRATF